MDWSFILLCVGGGLLVLWIGVKLLKNWTIGQASMVATPKEQVTEAARVWLMIQGIAGPEFRAAVYDDTYHGYVLDGRFYPREFVRQVRNGNGIFAMATHFQFPADGDTSHGGAWGDLVEVEQAHALASWTDYDRARRRLNWSAVWERGDGSLAGLKNMAYGVMVVCLLLVTFQVFSIKSGVASLRDVVVVKQVANPVSPAAAENPLTARPTGDR